MSLQDVYESLVLSILPLFIRLGCNLFTAGYVLFVLMLVICLVKPFGHTECLRYLIHANTALFVGFLACLAGSYMSISHDDKVMVAMTASRLMLWTMHGMPLSVGTGDHLGNLFRDFAVPTMIQVYYVEPSLCTFLYMLPFYYSLHRRYIHNEDRASRDEIRNIATGSALSFLIVSIGRLLGIGTWSTAAVGHGLHQIAAGFPLGRGRLPDL